MSVSVLVFSAHGWPQRLTPVEAAALGSWISEVGGCTVDSVVARGLGLY